MSLHGALLEAACALAGVVAGEGSFFITRKAKPFVSGETRLRFVFELKMAARDRPLLEALRAMLGYGSISDHPPQKTHWQPVSALTINSLTAHERATIPFADRFLPPSAKRHQFDRWRDHYQAYVAAHPIKYGRGRSPCSVEGCEAPVRGRGLCRRHYYLATGY